MKLQRKQAQVLQLKADQHAINQSVVNGGTRLMPGIGDKYLPIITIDP